MAVMTIAEAFVEIELPILLLEVEAMGRSLEQSKHEIERLKAENARLKAELPGTIAQTAEVERLKAVNEETREAWATLVKGKDAEIEAKAQEIARLQAELEASRATWADIVRVQGAELERLKAEHRSWLSMSISTSPRMERLRSWWNDRSTWRR